MSRSVAILIPPRAELSSVALATDLLQLANRYSCKRTGELRERPTRQAKAPLRTRWLSLDGAPVRLASGSALNVDGAIGNTSSASYDAVLVAAFETRDARDWIGTLGTLSPAVDWLRLQAKRETWIAACGGSIGLLAEAGLLDGKPACVPWWLEAAFHRRYPAAALQRSTALTHAPGVLCAGPMSAWPALALRLLREITSPNTADWVEKTTLIDATAPASPEALQLHGLVETASLDPLVARAQYWLQQRYSEPVRLDELAASLAVSARTLLRRFRQSTGLAPQAYLQRLRMESARRMLDRTTLPVEQIGRQVGYDDPAFFARLFKRENGMTPSGWRGRAS